MRYNLVLLPTADKVNDALIRLASEASIDRGLAPEYLLKSGAAPSIPHVSVIQFETTSETPALQLIWQHAIIIWEKILANQPSATCTLSTDINYMHSTTGPFAGMSWAAILIDKTKNSFIQHFHDKLREKLAPLGVTCLNAAGQHYDPHITLFSIKTDSLLAAEKLTEIPETHLPTLRNFTIRPALGEANDRWELITKLDEEKLF